MIQIVLMLQITLGRTGILTALSVPNQTRVISTYLGLISAMLYNFQCGMGVGES